MKKGSFYDGSVILEEPLLPQTVMATNKTDSYGGELANSQPSPVAIDSPPRSDTPPQRNILLFGYNDDDPNKILFPKNIVITSRYTIISFFPKSLLEQFRRLANVYFLVIGAIAIGGAYSNYYQTSVDPVGILVPVMAVVLISMIKDGVEDIKRHQSDAKVNSKPVKVITPDGTVSLSQRQHLKVGSLVLLQRDDEIPADVVVLQCGGIQGPLSYVETAAIDGETNLKIRLPALGHIPTFVQIPETNANLTTTNKPNQSSKNADHERKSLRTSNLSISGSRDFVYGVDWLRDRLRIETEQPNESIYRFNGVLHLASPKTFIVDINAPSEIIPLSDKNLLLRGSVLRATEWCIGIVAYTGRETKLSLNSKRPPSKLSSVDKIVNRTLLIAISVMILVCVISMALSIVWVVNNQDAHYLCIHESDLDNVYTQGGGCNSGTTSTVLTIFTFATLYNNFVCISMYVSLEMVYLCQSFFLNQDITIYDPETDTRAECHSSGLCADLGQIQYILSDKTGTLTKNIMKLRRCALINRVYGGPIGNTNAVDSVETYEALENLHPLIPYKQNNLHTKVSETEVEIMKDFLRMMTLCNNVILLPDNKGVLSITDLKSLEASLQAESPEEVALVLAAAQFTNSYIIARNSISATVVGINSYQQFDDTETWEILAVNEFDNVRKRQSILLRSATRNLLLCKGADSSMFSNCRVDGNPYAMSVMNETENFASQGLRTLVGAKRDLSKEQADAWLKSYQSAKISVYERESKLYECACAIEVEMDLLGCLGIEDELQDNVSTAISTLQSAGLNVWMITGDKAETAIAIGKQCALLTEKQTIFRLISLSEDEIHDALDSLRNAVKLSNRNFEKKPEAYLPGIQWPHLEKQSSTITIQTTPSPMTSVDADEKDRPKFVGTSVGNHEINSSFAEESFSGFNTNDLTTNGYETRPSQKGLPTELSLVVDGATLEILWKSEVLKEKFASVMLYLPTVIACRVSPLQKAFLVRMIKTSPDRPITLAIGDGANDVGMINEATVGVGISGREGRHAANAADFAISQFRFLVPLLLEHGRYNYIRCSKLVLYSFYKNLLLVSLLVYYCFYSGFSGTIPLTSLVFTGYNFYLGLPIVVIGAVDFDVPKWFIYQDPRLAYDTGRKGELLNYWNMLRWCLWGFGMGLVSYVLCIRLIGGPTFLSSTYANGNTSYLDIYGVGLNLPTNGWTGGIYVDGFTIFTIIIVAMQIKTVAMTQTRTAVFWWSIAVSMIGYLIFVLAYGAVDNTTWFNVVPTAFSTSTFWVGLIVIPTIIAVIDELVDMLASYFHPSSMDVLRKRFLAHVEMKSLEKATVIGGRKNSNEGVSLSRTNTHGMIN